LGGFVQPSFRFQLSDFSISAFAQLWPWNGFGWLRAISFLISAFSFQHFSFCQRVALCSPLSDFSFQHFSISAFAQLWPWGGLPAQSRATDHESPPAFGGFARPFDVGSWKLEVGCSMFDKSSEYNFPPCPPWRWSGGTLVPPWTCPIPIDPPQTPVFDQPGLSKSLSCGSPDVQRCSGLDVGCWMLDVQHRIAQARLRAPRPSRSQDQTGLNAETQRNAEKRRENEVSAGLCDSLRLCVTSSQLASKLGYCSAKRERIPPMRPRGGCPRLSPPGPASGGDVPCTLYASSATETGQAPSGAPCV
jgi:hypothetical protein